MHDLAMEALEGAWRSLCVGMLAQGILKVEASSKLHKPGSKQKCNGDGGLDKELLKQKAEAKKWISGGVGIVTFEECCEAAGVDPERARERIAGWCRDRRRKPVYEQRGRSIA